MIATRPDSPGIKPWHRVVLFPTFGCRAGSGWDLAVHGAVFAPAADDFRSRMLVQLLRRILKASEAEVASEIFRHRVAGFLQRGQKGLRLTVEFGSTTRELARRTSRDGHFRARLRLSQDDLAGLFPPGGPSDTWLPIRALTARAVDNGIIGSIHLLAASGVSVISDIDDTLKHTGVARRSILTNTFLREFEVIGGMPSLFRQWAAGGAAFHYVSSSPWQLYQPLKQLMDLEGYPAGSFHLKAVRFRDASLLKLFLARRMGKRLAISSILKNFPHRRFVLVGDSGEKDPEIYGAMARKFPAQVTRIFIRNVPERPVTLMRAQKAFRNVRPDCWQVFHDANELAGAFPS